MNSDIYVIGMDRHVYHLNNAGTGWDDLNGSPFTYISAGDPMNIWGVGPTSGGHNDYRFGETSIQFSRTYSGSVTCAVPPPYGQQICAQFNHTAQAQVSFGRGTTGAVAHATPWNGPGSWGVTATVIAHPQDLFTCLLNADPADCNAWENSGNMQCSGGGSNNDLSNPFNWQIELATTLEKMRSTQVPPSGECVTNNGVTECQYDTIPWCTAATSPPDLNPTGVRRVFKATYPTYWKVFALCERPGPGTAWICEPPSGLASLGAVLPDNSPLVDCTKHP